MARLLTREEFAKDLAERAKVLTLMTDNQKVCSVCHTLFKAGRRSGRFSDCMCDYESPALWDN